MNGIEKFCYMEIILDIILIVNGGNENDVGNKDGSVCLFVNVIFCWILNMFNIKYCIKNFC